MLASVAAELGAALLTRNPADFAGIGDVAHVVAVQPSALAVVAPPTPRAFTRSLSNFRGRYVKKTTSYSNFPELRERLQAFLQHQ